MVAHEIEARKIAHSVGLDSFGDFFIGVFLSLPRNEFCRQWVLLRKFADSDFQIRVKSVADVPLVQRDSDLSRQRSAKHFLGDEETKFSRFHTVVVPAERLEQAFLSDGVVSDVVARQATGAILTVQGADWSQCVSKYVARTTRDST